MLVFKFTHVSRRCLSIHRLTELWLAWTPWIGPYVYLRKYNIFWTINVLGILYEIAILWMP